MKTSTERKNLLEKLSYACDKCDKLFLSYTVLKSHKNEKHKCFHCDDEFALSIQRINHTIRKHFKSKLYCEVPECSGKFKRKEAYLKHVLQSHQNIGTDELTFLLQKIKELRPDLQKLKYI